MPRISGAFCYSFYAMESLLLILALGGILGLIVVFKKQSKDNPEKDSILEGSEE